MRSFRIISIFSVISFFFFHMHFLHQGLHTSFTIFIYIYSIYHKHVLLGHFIHITIHTLSSSISWYLIKVQVTYQNVSFFIKFHVLYFITSFSPKTLKQNHLVEVRVQVVKTARERMVFFLRTYFLRVQFRLLHIFSHVF